MNGRSILSVTSTCGRFQGTVAGIAPPPYFTPAVRTRTGETCLRCHGRGAGCRGDPGEERAWSVITWIFRPVPHHIAKLPVAAPEEVSRYRVIGSASTLGGGTGVPFPGFRRH